jgi:hypothetical protein
MNFVVYSIYSYMYRISYEGTVYQYLVRTQYVNFLTSNPNSEPDLFPNIRIWICKAGSNNLHQKVISEDHFAIPERKRQASVFSFN